MRKLLIALVACTSVWSGCVRDTYLLDEDLVVEDLDPSFAAPLLEAHLNMGDIEQAIDDENFIYNDDEASFALIYPTELFSVLASDLIEIPVFALSDSYTVDASTASTLNALPAGTSFTDNASDVATVDLPAGQELNTIVVKSGSLVIESSSDIPFDLDYTIDFTSILDGGNQPLMVSDLLDFTGSLPITSDNSFDLTGYTIHLADAGTNSLPFTVNATFTSEGQNTSAGSALSFSVSFENIEFERVEGNLGQEFYTFQADTQDVDLYKDLNGGILHFENPSISILFRNSTGVSFGLEFTSLIAPENQSATSLSGPDLTNLPVIMAAQNFGDIALTEHTITNQGTSPQLSEMMDEGPFHIIYSSEVQTNPDGLTENFVLDTSFMSCTAEVVLPFYGYADNFSISDTLDFDLETELGFDPNDSSEVIGPEDVERITMRFQVDNGLPIEIGIQVVFLDDQQVVIDSLFVSEDYTYIFQPGYVDFSLPDSDPNHGKVLSPTRTTTDVVLTGDRMRSLIDQQSSYIILRAVGNTSMASQGELIKIYPEYNVDIRVAAKLDTQINLNE
ncbi:MAG: hypothetical protein KDC12_14625 [Flavobacteriales bacterium]|nr:hypothetical protein [Flavobacteriales bacterium]